LKRANKSGKSLQPRTSRCRDGQPQEPDRSKAADTPTGVKPADGTSEPGPPDAAAVCRGLKLLREVVGDLSPGDDPLRIVVLPVDALLSLVDLVDSAGSWKGVSGCWRR
jgi:hypothetical protein